MDNAVTFSLHDQVRYRREVFGGVALRVDLQETRFFNKTGAQIIEGLASGRSLAGLCMDIDTDDIGAVGDFVASLVEHGIAIPGHVATAADLLLGNPSIGVIETAPLGVELELTLRCGRSCSYCAYEAVPSFSTEGELTTDQWYATLERLYKAGVFFVRFTGGDPLLRPDFADILDFANTLGFVITVGSDLTRLTGEHVAALAAADNLYALQTTLDGASPASANRLRGAGNFERVVDGVRRLKQAGVPVIVGTVLTRSNAPEIGAIARFVGELGADGYCVAPLYAAGRAQAASVARQVPTNEDLAEAAGAFAVAVEQGWVRAADPAWAEVADGLGAEGLASLWSDQPHLVRSPDQLIRVDPRGRLYTSIKLKPSLREAIYVGNVLSDDIVTVWNRSEQIEALRHLPRRESYFGAVVDVRSPEFQEWRQ